MTYGIFLLYPVRYKRFMKTYKNIPIHDANEYKNKVLNRRTARKRAAKNASDVELRSFFTVLSIFFLDRQTRFELNCLLTV